MRRAVLLLLFSAVVLVMGCGEPASVNPQKQLPDDPKAVKSDGAVQELPDPNKK